MKRITVTADPRRRGIGEGFLELIRRDYPGDEVVLVVKYLKVPSILEFTVEDVLAHTSSNGG